MKSKDHDCEPVYTEHEFERYVTVYHVICRKCKKHIAWYNWLPKEGNVRGTRASSYIRENYNPY